MMRRLVFVGIPLLAAPWVGGCSSSSSGAGASGPASAPGAQSASVGVSATASEVAASAAPSGPTSAVPVGVAGPGSVPVVVVQPTAPPSDGASAPAPPTLPAGDHALDGTNLIISMPGQVTLLPMGSAGPGYLVRGEQGCEVMVTPADPGLPQTLDEVRARIQNDTIRWRKFERIEGTPQGWTIEYETDGLSNPTRVAYGVNVRRNLEGEEVACSRILETREAAKCALAACQSLRRVQR